jgi:hypothetical protein
MFVGQTTILGSKEVWKTKYPNKCCFFAWLVLLGRNWTSERLWRHEWRDDAVCTLCAQEVELIDHLLTGCMFSHEIWFKVSRHCGWHNLSLTPQSCMVEWWLAAWKRVLKAHRKAFNCIVVLVAWLECKAMVFNSVTTLSVAMVEYVWSLADLWCRAQLISRSELVGV